MAILNLKFNSDEERATFEARAHDIHQTHEMHRHEAEREAWKLTLEDRDKQRGLFE